jgi:hypothetical protein
MGSMQDVQGQKMKMDSKQQWTSAAERDEWLSRFNAWASAVKEAAEVDPNSSPPSEVPGDSAEATAGATPGTQGALPRFWRSSGDVVPHDLPGRADWTSPGEREVWIEHVELLRKLMHGLE